MYQDSDNFAGLGKISKAFRYNKEERAARHLAPSNNFILKKG